MIEKQLYLCHISLLKKYLRPQSVGAFFVNLVNHFVEIQKRIRQKLHIVNTPLFNALPFSMSSMLTSSLYNKNKPLLPLTKSNKCYSILPSSILNKFVLFE